MVKQIGRHLTIKGEFDAQRFHTNVDYYLIDDMKTEDFKYYNQIIQGTNFTYTGKFVRMTHSDGGRRYGKHGIPSIWTTNYHPFYHHTHGVDVTWLRENLLVMDIGDMKMYLANDEEDREYECQTHIPKAFAEELAEFEEYLTGIRRKGFSCFLEWSARRSEERMDNYLGSGHCSRNRRGSYIHIG